MKTRLCLLLSAVLLFAGPLLLRAQTAPAAHCGDALYPNNREPLLQGQYVKLPLGAVKPGGWLRDQLVVEANGLTGHLNEVWDVAKTSAWKGDAGKNVTPEPCYARFVPRWLSGLVPLACLLDDPRLKKTADQYMNYLLDVQDVASVTPSVEGWSHLARVLPDYYEATHDERSLKLCRKILDYAYSVRDSTNDAVTDPERLGMTLSFGWWYYNLTGDKDIPDLVEKIAKKNVDDCRNYFTGTNVSDFDMAGKDFDTVSEHRPHHGQGVDVNESIQYPALYYLKSKDDSYKACVFSALSILDKADGQVGGRWNADEWLAGLDPTSGTELCDVTELIYSLQKDFEALGNVCLADRLEQLMFNSFPGTCTPDMWAHQYDQQANQVLVSADKRNWHWNDENANIYGFSPNYPCCLANMHSPWPRYVEYMWMATGDNGLVAAAYGPCEVKARVAGGADVRIREETAYPFSDLIRFIVNVGKPAVFPLYFRMPVWAGQAELSVSGQTRASHPPKGEMFKVERQWNDGDVVTLAFHYQVRAETRKNDSVSIAWGPLYFVLRIGEAFKEVQIKEDSPVKTKKPTGRVNWRIDPTTDWNYALDLDRNHPQYTMSTNKISACPFAQKGEPVWNSRKHRYTAWNQDVPMILKMKARKVPQWVMDGANAGPTPASPVHGAADETTVELIPYGCSRLRISEFPTIANGNP